MQRDKASLLDTARSATLVMEFVSGMDKITLAEDVKTQAAILYEIIIIMGEAVKRLSTEFIDEHPEILWGEIRGMRNRLTHEYDKVDINIVWDTIQNDIPQFLAAIQPLLPIEEESE
jgi:uncharacterized protein with HEPN domain